MDFTVVNVDWYTSTFIFYLSIILGCYLIALLVKRRKIMFNKNLGIYTYAWSFLLTIILLFVKGFGTTGRDLRSGYYYNFLSAASLKVFRDQTLEIGYRILNVVIHFISDKYWFFVFVVSVLTVYPMIKIIKKYSNNIDIPVAVLMYTSIFFVNGFSPFRMALAATIALYAFDAMVENKPLKALCWIMLGSCFHITVLVLIVPYFFSMARSFNKKLTALSLLTFFALVYLGRNSIAAFMSGSERYYLYSSFERVHIGLEQFVYYIPLFLLFFSVQKSDDNRQFSRVSFSYLAMGLCCGLIGYIISIFGRLQMLFLPLIIIIAYYCKLYKERFPKKRKLLDFLVLFYCIARFVIYITQYYNLEDLMPYTNIFGWII